MGGFTFSEVFLNFSCSGLRAVATAMSPLSMTSWTRWLPKPVEVPVMKKTRGMMVDDVAKDLVVRCFFKDAARNMQSSIQRKEARDSKRRRG